MNYPVSHACMSRLLQTLFSSLHARCSVLYALAAWEVERCSQAGVCRGAPQDVLGSSNLVQVDIVLQGV